LTNGLSTAARAWARRWPIIPCFHGAITADRHQRRGLPVRRRCRARKHQFAIPFLAGRNRAADREKTRLSVSVEKFSDGKLFVRVLAPLGVLLPRGLGLKIDDVEIGHAPFVRCQAAGCYAQMVVEGTLAQQLKIGKTAIFSIFQIEEAGVGFPKLPDLARRFQPGAC
jgi:hypothetical protein